MTATYEDFDRAQWAARRRATTTVAVRPGDVTVADILEVYGPVGNELGERAVDLEDVGDGDVSGSDRDGGGGAPPRRPLRPVEILVGRRHDAARYAEPTPVRAGGRGATSVSFGA